jgi:serine/threonine protein kinase
MDSTSDSQGPVELLAEEFLDRRTRGERPTIGEYCERHPQHAEEIREVFEALLMVEDLKPGSSDQSESIGGAGFVPAPNGRRLERIGGYRVLREIGRGGMGVVYEAEQEALGRRVALKVLPGSSAGDAKARARFEREARAAARMHHTNIVPVFDVGQGDGQVYYAMQMIHGQGLDLVIEELKGLRDASNAPSPEKSIAASLIAGRFAREDLAGTDRDGKPAADVEATADYTGEAHGSAILPGQSELSSAQSNRRAYFRSVAQIGHQTASALSYAHARGVVHRDIKPSNLLLDAAGVVWITDFGLAKTGDLGMTASGDILGTIRYMAPERFRGHCDARSDTYALGLTLYELLTLHPAFAHDDRLQLIEQIRRAEPAPPRTLDRKVPRDLETIVLKAIDKDPKRRYQSADELGEDLQRFLADEPVHARRIWLPERFARWVRRNPVVAGLTAGIFLVMAVGTVVSRAQANRALKAEAAALAAAQAEKTARKDAEEHDAETKAVLEFVENKVFAAARPEGQEGGLGREVSLREAIESSLPYVADSFTTRPLIEARLRMTLGKSYAFLGEHRIAEQQFEAARAIYTKHRGPDHPDTPASMENLADCYVYLSRPAEAFRLREETLTLRKSTMGPDHPDTLRSQFALAKSYIGIGRIAEQVKLLEQTLALQQSGLGPGHPDTIQTMLVLAMVYMGTDRSADAVELCEKIIAQHKKEGGREHPDTLMALVRLSLCYSSLGRHSEALRLAEELCPKTEIVFGPNHIITLQAKSRLAGLYTQLGRFAEALRLIETAVTRAATAHDREHYLTLVMKVEQARLTALLGRHEESLKLREEILSAIRTRLGPENPFTPRLMAALAEIAFDVGRHSEALTLHQEVLAWRQAKLGPENRATLWSMSSVVACLVKVGRLAEAGALARESAELFEKQHRAQPRDLYAVACFRAIVAAAIRASDKSPEGEKQAVAEADRAMAWLKKAVDAGFINHDHMTKDTDLDVLRDRADFKALMSELKANVDKKP